MPRFLGNREIFCISLLFTKTTESPKTKITPDEYRIALEQFINQKRKEDDKNIHFIAGDSITSEKNLRHESSDPVNLGIDGAASFAPSLKSTKSLAPKP